MDSAKEILDSTDNEYVRKMAEFVLNTKRGIPFERRKEIE
jgi:UDP-N-acetylglucosamine acyltransferase